MKPSKRWDGTKLKQAQNGDIYAGDMDTIRRGADSASFWRAYGKDGKEYIRCSNPDVSYLVEDYYP